MRRVGSKTLLVALPLLVGCAGRLDMAKAYDDKRAAMIIEYSGVREVGRRHTDYSQLDARILRADGSEKARPR